MRRLKHANVLPVLSAWREDEHMWLVTPYCKGGSVADILKVCERPAASSLHCPLLVRMPAAESRAACRRGIHEA